ncbi:MAG: DsbA family protein [Paracoccus sp. (in: a-proteobacteria)]|nr:DsbA family protein [Paracoccus sp. (in: a-proteobacteria)]
MKTLICALMLSATPVMALDLSAMNESEKTAFGAAVRDYLIENPEILIEVMNVLEQRHLAEASANDAALIARLSDQIYDDGHSWSGGNPDGDVTVVEFIDYRCGVCQRAFPEVEHILANDSNIRVIFKDLPVLGDESRLAARFATAVMQLEGADAYKRVHDHFYQMRGNITPESLHAIATDMGFDADALIAALDSDAVTDVLAANAQLAQQLQIGGTPSFIIGETILRGLPPTGITPVIAETRMTEDG